MDSLGYSKTRTNILFGSILISSFLGSAVLSLQGPFLPPIADSKGIPPSQYGFIFSVYSLFSFISSPVIGSFLTRIGSRIWFIGGLVVLALSTIAFSFIDYVEDPLQFLSVAIILRIVEAAGQTSFKVSSNAVITQLYPESTAFMISIAQTTLGVGLMVGPGIGGFLYEYGGFALPFVTVGGSLLLSTSISCVLLPNLKGESPKTESLKNKWKVLLVPGIWINLFGCFVTNLAQGFLTSLLEPHLRRFHLSASQVGLMFMIAPIFFTIFVPLTGRIVGTRCTPRTLFSFGFIIKMIGFSLIGPLPYTDIEPSIPLTIAGLSLHGISAGFLITGGLMDLINLGRSSTDESEEAIVGLMTALYGMTFSLGSFVAPSFGGILLDHIGFRMETFILVVLNIIAHFLLTVHSIYEYCSNPEDEQKPLLPSRRRETSTLISTGKR